MTEDAPDGFRDLNAQMLTALQNHHSWFPQSLMDGLVHFGYLTRTGTAHQPPHHHRRTRPRRPRPRVLLRYTLTTAHQVHITYRAADGETTDRVIEPGEVRRSKAGDWYVRAFDQLRDAARSFRLDRITNCQTAYRRERGIVPPRSPAGVRGRCPVPRRRRRLGVLHTAAALRHPGPDRLPPRGPALPVPQPASEGLTRNQR